MTHRIAILGAGPAGCYTAQALRKSMPEAEITVIDKLPVPYGLVRYGVAGDHQGTKAITRQFARVFERQDVAFIGNVEVGRDIELSQIRDAMDVVILATGLYTDRALPAGGDDTAGIYGAGAVTRHWNGHPDDGTLAPDFGRSVAIIGNGNVALDVARLLAKSPDEFEGSDVDLSVLQHQVEDIHIIGRAGLEAAKFDVAMVREFAGIAGLSVHLAEGDALAPEQSDVAAAVASVIDPAKSGAPRRLTFHAGWTSAAVTTLAGRVSGLTLARTNGGAQKELACDSIVTAIGFEQDPTTVADPATGQIETGLYATGWLRRGPTGTIPENRKDAQEVAAAVTDWLGGVGKSARPGRAALETTLADVSTSYSDWLAIDEIERAHAPENRCRQKLRTLAEMLATIRQARG